MRTSLAAQSRRSPDWPDLKAAMLRQSRSWARRSLRWPDSVGLAPYCFTLQIPSGTTFRFSSLAGFEVTANGRFSVTAHGRGARPTQHVPAVAPTGKLISCLTTCPAPGNIRFAVTVTASSTAGGDCVIACRSASFRAGPNSSRMTHRSCPAFSDHPLPTTGERMIGKRYMRECTEILGPAGNEKPKAVKSFQPEVNQWMFMISECPRESR